MKKAGVLALLVVLSLYAEAQELFPVAEPASSVPRGALGVRFFSEGYKEADLFRNLTGVKFLYGLTPKLSVYVTATASDYHQETLPFDFITHTHAGGQVIGGAQVPAQGIAYPEVFNSLDIYAKYRFITLDQQNKHFRMAAYGEGSYVAVPSHEAEPDLLVHTSGFGAGVISTYLSHHFATSLTAGFILPSRYSGNATDIYGGVYPTTITYGNAANYRLSFGYLLWPQKYTGYNQTNWNVYVEFTGKSYTGATVSQKDGPAPDALPIPVSSHTPILHAGNYIDIDPGVQCIINSTYRIDASMALQLLNKTYAHQYPLYRLGIQRYFYFNNHKKSDKL